MKARILVRDTSTDVTGRSVESIARTYFGRRATVHPEHSEAFEPATLGWTVTGPAHPRVGGRLVLGRIITYPALEQPGTPRRRGRPRVGTLVTVRVPDVTLAGIKAEAAERGIPEAEVMRERLARAGTRPNG